MRKFPVIQISQREWYEPSGSGGKTFNRKDKEHKEKKKKKNDNNNNGNKSEIHFKKKKI